MEKQKHFKLTDEIIKLPDGTTLYRIECISPIESKGVKVGDKGGFIEKKNNLCGDAWVFGNARVGGNAKVSDDAEVRDNARVFGNARIRVNAKVYGEALVYDSAEVAGNACVYGNARIRGSAIIDDNAEVSDYAEVFDRAIVRGFAKVSNSACVYGTAKVCDIAKIRRQRDVCWFSVFGPCDDTITAFICKDGIVRVSYELFFGDIETFSNKIEKDLQDDSEYLDEYRTIIQCIKARFSIKD